MNEGTRPGERHLSAESFDRCLLSRVPVEHPIKGDPQVTLFIDPIRSETGLRIPAEEADNIIETGRENVQVRTIYKSAARYLEVVVDDPKVFPEAYPLLCGVADRVQLEGMTVHAALASTIRLFDSLLRRDPVLNVEREIGLLGELLILRALCDEIGMDDAVAGWRGPASEEHDFSIYELDLEIKTTSAERRAHWIESLTQLVPTAKRPLWLISHQLTRGGPGNGWTVRELIEDLRQAMGDGSQVRDLFERRLVAAGWVKIYERSAGERWLRRAPSLVFAVGPDFPQLTPSLLNAAGAQLDHIPDVRYRIDLTEPQPAKQVPQIVTSLLTYGDTHD